MTTGADEIVTIATKRTHLFAVGIDCVTQTQSVEWICRRAGEGRGGFVVTVNLDHLRRCKKDASYARLVGGADLVVADGMPLIWASRVQGAPLLPERVAGSSMMVELCARAADRGLSIFLLGGDAGVADRAADVLRDRHPEIRIAGTYCPPFGFENDPAETARIESALTDSNPAIVLVALGSPKQERLIERMRSTLPHACWMGVGISLSFITGDVTRAPRWVQRLGLEWVHRLVQEPRRLFQRYIIHGIPWGIRLLAHASLNRFRPAQPPSQPTPT